MQENHVWLRFYEELNDHLPPEQRKLSFRHFFHGRVSVKDLLESVGVPHTEIDLILVNGDSVDFNYLVQQGDRISVYPMFERFDIAAVSKVRPEPLRAIKFVLDVHLGKLANYLRMAGFDTLYERDYFDAELAAISSSQHRILLTRDRGLLKHRIIQYGHFVRQTDPLKQLQEIIRWFDLYRLLNPFSRCIRCNGILQPVDKSDIQSLLPPGTSKYYHTFRQCRECHQVYWKGSHYQKMQRLLSKINPPEEKKPRSDNV